MGDNQWDRLPLELQRLILEHRAATLIQTTWIRFTNFAHVKKAGWPVVRLRLQDLGLLFGLVKYPNVRREWRTEMSSWVDIEEELAHVIIYESAAGLWGPATQRLIQSNSS